MTTTFLIVSNGENTGNIYYGEERINGVSVTACDDGGLDTRGEYGRQVHTDRRSLDLACRFGAAAFSGFAPRW